MKLKDGILLKKVMGNYMVVSTLGAYSHVDSMQTVNETGAFLWRYLEEGTDEDEMVGALLGEFDVTEDVARRDVSEFVEKIRAAELLEE